MTQYEYLRPANNDTRNGELKLHIQIEKFELAFEMRGVTGNENSE